jgi:hypothetical protein
MNTTEASSLMLVGCCAHLMSRGDGPFTARARTVAATAGLPAEVRAPEPVTAAEPTAVRLPAPRAVSA